VSVPVVLVRVHFAVVVFLGRRCLPVVEPVPEGGEVMGFPGCVASPVR
jgi:hypothetical protein